MLCSKTVLFRLDSLVLTPCNALGPHSTLLHLLGPQAHVKFQKLQMAYDVLRDPEKRRMYDKGQLIQ